MKKQRDRSIQSSSVTMNRLKIHLTTVALLTVVWSSYAAKTVEWFHTNSQQQWVKKGPVQTVSTIPNGTTVITINTDSLKQEILGWGGCFNEKGWEALSVLSTAGRDSVIRALFDTAGCAFNYCRMPIGASDYAVSRYSLDDSAGDYALKYFSIDRDRLRLIPYIKAAQTFCPDLQVWGVPWSVPLWMMNSGVFCTSPMFTSLALYFEKYVQAYRQEGLNVVAVHVMNEPCGGGGGVNTQYTAAQMRDFVRDYLGPRFVQDNVKAEIWLGDLNCVYDPYVSTTLNDPEAAKYVTGVGLQYGGRPDLPKVPLLFPSKKVMQTETHCYDGKNDWQQGWEFVQWTNTDLNGGANAYMEWNMVLDETGANFTSGWVQNSMITVNKATKAVTYNPQFHYEKHYSHFVKRGARRIKVSGASGSNSAVAFLNPSGDVVVVDWVQSTGNVAFKVGADAAVVNVTEGLHTFVIKQGVDVVKVDGAKHMLAGKFQEHTAKLRVFLNAFTTNSAHEKMSRAEIYDVRGAKIGQMRVGPSGVIVVKTK